MDAIAYNAALGDRIRRARENLKMSQQDIADHFGYKSQAVSKWERGLSAPPVAIMIDLAKFLQVPFTWLAGQPGSIDADLYLVPMEDREFAAEQAKRTISRWISKS
jgi:transcriptional regulator with XRE-family HTH domain